MATSHDEIFITIIPDDYHIHFAGKKSDGKQVFVTSDLNYDANVGKTTDYIVVYNWDYEGYFIDAQVTELGVRGEYKDDDAAKIYEKIINSINRFTPHEIKVKPCRFEYDGIEFGFIPRTDEDYTYVEVMPGNCLCFTEPFNGDYDT